MTKENSYLYCRSDAHRSDAERFQHPDRKRFDPFHDGPASEHLSPAARAYAPPPAPVRGPAYAAAFDMLQFALRLGDEPRQAITTTLRPNALKAR